MEVTQLDRMKARARSLFNTLTTVNIIFHYDMNYFVYNDFFLFIKIIFRDRKEKKIIIKVH